MIKETPGHVVSGSWDLYKSDMSGNCQTCLATDEKHVVMARAGQSAYESNQRMHPGCDLLMIGKRRARVVRLRAEGPS